MELFFSAVGITVCIIGAGAALTGTIFGLISVFEYFSNLKATLYRIENLIKAGDYTGAEEASNVE